MEYLLPYSCMVTVLHIMVGLERMLDYRSFGLAGFHCIYTCLHSQTHNKPKMVDSAGTTYKYIQECDRCFKSNHGISTARVNRFGHSALVGHSNATGM